MHNVKDNLPFTPDAGSHPAIATVVLRRERSIVPARIASLVYVISPFSPFGKNAPLEVLVELVL